MQSLIPCSMFLLQGAQFSSSNCDYFLLGKLTPKNSIYSHFIGKKTEACKFSISLSRLCDSRITLHVQAIYNIQEKKHTPSLQ